MMMMMMMMDFKLLSVSMSNYNHNSAAESSQKNSHVIVTFLSHKNISLFWQLSKS